MMMPRLLHTFILVMAVAPGGHAIAQMYKCTGADGKMGYSDRPCESGVKQADVEGRMTGRVPAIQYYELYSRDWQGMRQEIDQKSRQGFHGFASWKVNYTYRWNRLADGQCAISGVVPTFEGEIRIPNWVPGPNVSAAQRDAWQRYFAALKVHEEGHIAHGKQLASALAQLSGLRIDCSAADTTIKQRADALLKQYQAADVEYDRTTNHGAAQGAVLQ